MRKEKGLGLGLGKYKWEAEVVGERSVKARVKIRGQGNGREKEEEKEDDERSKGKGRRVIQHTLGRETMLEGACRATATTMARRRPTKANANVGLRVSFTGLATIGLLSSSYEGMMEGSVFFCDGRRREEGINKSRRACSCPN
jgi:hypothetical protein